MIFFFKNYGSNRDINNDILSILTKLVLDSTFFSIITDKGFAMTEIKEGVDMGISAEINRCTSSTITTSRTAVWDVFSRKKAMAPSPPFPLLTSITARSINIVYFLITSLIMTLGLLLASSTALPI